MDLRCLNKEERDCILMMELEKILWECLIPSEFFKNLFQKELNIGSFVIFLKTTVLKKKKLIGMLQTNSISFGKKI